MSETNEPPRPDGPAGEPAPTPPSSEAPPPPPPASPFGAQPGQPGEYGSDAGQGGGGYGAPPPASPYGQPAGPGAYSPTEAISFGWDRFKASPATLLIPMIVAWVGLVVIAVIVELLLVRPLSDNTCTRTANGFTVSHSCGPGFFTRLLIGALASAIILLVFQFLVAGLYRGALRVADGQDFGVGQLFEGWDKTQVAIAALLIAAATFVGTLLCYIPGLIAGFLVQFTLLFIVDQQMKAVDAIRASVRLVVDNLGSTIVFYLLALVVTIIGACLCGVGLLVAYPVVLVAYAYTYRRLQGQPVGPA
jgi:uncharacterized membrane protein